MLQDLRYAFRTLRRSPAFAFTAVLTLALGIGTNTMMFSVVNAVLLRPLPFPDPERLVAVYSFNRHANVGRIRASALDFGDWRRDARSFDAMAGYIGNGFTFSGDGEPELAIGQGVTSDFFRTMDVQPLAGRTFTPDEFTPGHERVIVLSHALWQRRFSGDRAVIGRTVTVNGKPFTVVGVMPPGFTFPDPR